MNFHENEEAVSPVIGVILMVAITVILAAVIAVFVFGMAGDVQSTKSIGVTAKQSGGSAIITYMGGPDHASVESIAATIDGSPWTGDTTNVTSTNTAEPDVGASWTVKMSKLAGSPDPADQNRVVVIATFSDGTSQVLLDTTI